MKKILLSIVSLVFVNQANAGFMAEPWVGYATGKVECTTLAGAACGTAMTGSHYGARLGWMFGGGFWTSAEYAGGAGTLKPDSGAADETYQITTLGVTLGIDMMNGMRVYLGYGFSNNLKDKTVASEITVKGTETKLGIGYKFKNGVSANLEYHMATASKVDAAPLTDIDANTIWTKFSPTMSMLTIGYVFGSGK